MKNKAVKTVKRLVGNMRLDNFDLNEQKIGVLTADNPKNHLHRLIKMVITIGEKRSSMEILGAETNQGRPRIRREVFINESFPRQARECALRWKILRKNIEVKYENTTEA